MISNQFFPTIDANFSSKQDLFNYAYINSFPPAVRAMVRISDLEKRTQEAIRLVPGYLIDSWVQVLQMNDPYTSMAIRIAEGFRWIRAAKATDFDATPQTVDVEIYKSSLRPSDGMLVSLNPDDFKLFVDLSSQPKPFNPWVYMASTGPDRLGPGSIWQGNNQIDQDGYGLKWTDPLTGAVYEKFYQNGWNGEKIILWERIS